MASGNTWFLNVLDNQVIHVTNGPEADVLDLSTTWKSFPTQAAAEAAAKKDPVGKTLAPIGNAVAAVGSTADELGKIVTFPLAIDKWISNRQNIFRVLKVLVGAALILAGVNKISAIQSATSGAVSTAKKAAEVAAL